MSEVSQFPAGLWNAQDIPHNEAAEMTLLGILMVDNDRLADVRDILLADHFASTLHGTLYAAICTLVDAGRRAEPVTLADHMASKQDFDPAYIAGLFEDVWTTANAKDLAHVIHDCWLRRETILVGQTMVARAKNWNLDYSGEAIIDEAERDLVALRPQGMKGGFQTVSLSASVAIQNADEARKNGQPKGIQTGIRAYDDLTGGLHRKEAMLLGARPSMGKTGLVVSLAYNMARQGYRVGFFSLEETAEMIACRILARMTGMNLQRIRLSRGLTEHDIANITEASRKLDNLPLHIDDSRGLTIPQIHGRARKLQHSIGGLDVVLVDHLRKVAPVDRRSSAYDHINEISEGMTVLAGGLDVAVLCAAQLSRAAEGREDKRPTLADLRDSGRLEEDARTIAFLYREAYYAQRQEPKRGPAESHGAFLQKHAAWEAEYREIERDADLIVAKQNNGPLGNIPLRFDPQSTAFEGVN